MSDEKSRYRAVEERVFDDYTAGRYAEGAAAARAKIPQLPTYRADLAHLAACLLVLDGRPAEAYAELRAALDTGAWWQRRIMVEDDDLAALRELDGFDVLVETAHARALAAGERAAPPVVRRPAGPPAAVLVALHGAGEDAADAVAAWGPAVDAGRLLLAVESTQRSTPTNRSWPDHATGLRDITAALAALDPADRDLPVVAAGFSAGGRQAMLWALDAPVAAFVAVAPAIHPEQVDPEVVAAAARRGLTGWVVLGEHDDDVRDGALATVERLREHGLPCELELVPGLGHAFPDDFATRLPGLLGPPGPAA